MRAAILPAALTVSVAAGVGYLVWLDHERSAAATAVPAEVQSHAPAQHAVPAPPDLSITSPPKPSPNGVYKCVHGGQISYQGSPCMDGSNAAMAKGTLSVVAPPPIQVRAVEASRQAPSVALLERSDQQEPDDRCAALRKEIRWIDARARVRSTDSLTERRRHVKRQMYDLRCPELD